jgi:MFS family permease
MTQTANPIESARGLLAVRIFGCLAAGYFMSYGLRSVNAVLAPELSGELGLTNGQLGSLSSAYFLAFALMQLPLGIWLDRFGPRRVNAVLMTLAGVGCACFALSNTVTQLWLARALIGLGMSAGLMASLTAFRQWFDPSLQTRLAAWMLMAGTAGVLTATVPVHQALPLLGWRGVFWVCAAMLAGIGLLMWTVMPRGRERAPVRSRPPSPVPLPATSSSSSATGPAPQGPGDPPAVLSFWASMAGYGAVFRNGYFWRMSMTAGIVQGGFVAMQSLWVGPWLNRVLGYSGDAAADRLFLFNLGLLIAFLGLGVVAPRVPSERAALAKVVAWGTATVVALEVVIAFNTTPEWWWLWIAFATAATVYTLVQPRVGLAFPPELAGRALTGFNLIIFSWMFLSQWGFGVAIDLIRTTGVDEPEAFRRALLGLAALHGVCLVVFVGWPRRWGGR